MYIIRDAKNGNFIEQGYDYSFLKQQKLKDYPISPQSLTLKDADGLILSDGSYVGIYGKNMSGYPQVTVEEINGEPYIMSDLKNLKINGQSQSDLNAETQNLLLDTMSGVAEMYELLAETQTLQLDTMSGIADMYELAMNKEGGN